MKRGLLFLAAALLVLISVTSPLAAAETVSPAALPSSLDDFLQQYQWGQEEYDASSPLTGENVLTRIVSHGCCVNVRLYPGAMPREYWNKRDPRGYWNSYEAFDVAQVNWIAKNIFNLSDGDIETLTAKAEAEGFFYRSGSSYLTQLGGVGGPGYVLTYRLARIEDGKYHLIYNAAIEGYPSYNDTYYAVLSRKTVDGGTYWSLYKHSRTIPADFPGTPFADVSEKDYFGAAVEWAVEKGITSGTGATSFSPNANCTRAQMVTFLWRAMGRPAVSLTTPFRDVPKNEYYSAAVAWAARNGITAGTTATTFSPNKTVSRAEAVTFLWRAMGSPPVSLTTPFRDVPKDAYYSAAVAWAARDGITAGTTAATFSPRDPCKRCQIVTFLWRCLK